MRSHSRCIGSRPVIRRSIRIIPVRGDLLGFVFSFIPSCSLSSLRVVCLTVCHGVCLPGCLPGCLLACLPALPLFSIFFTLEGVLFLFLFLFSILPPVETCDTRIILRLYENRQKRHTYQVEKRFNKCFRVCGFGAWPRWGVSMGRGRKGTETKRAPCHAR